ncbi:cytochrome c peroxidase [Novosphingobium sp. CF614]|uniref:cytochrome-c peroxidase n=1 Tax=Novosphingobium sp. CF614 TaxID=1884364 RepID=UPI0008E92307|nr:cytochrome c peroxidase [Novosphingobium sp. CF614]SFG39656.1 cytochrome c peroxidase [Novosphingobium sp. CF614]
MKRCIAVLAGIAVVLFGIAAAAGTLHGNPPVPTDNPMMRDKVELGRRLFYDADLSVNGTMSCATCHEQKHGFADGNRAHPGALDDPGRRNVPGLANVAWFPRLTWADPRQTSLEAQIAVPVFGEHPIEMGMKDHEAEIARRLERDPCYVEMFRRAFPGDRGMIDYLHVAKAIAAFERTLVSRDSPYDRFVRGNVDAMTPLARQGLQIFQRDCASCHAGPDLTDAAYHRIAPENVPPSTDAGLAEVSGDRSDTGKFRTPSLRNLGVTAPYLHDGSATTISDAIQAHAAFAAIRTSDVDTLGAFMETLTDQSFLAEPGLALPNQACGRPL